MNIVTYNLNGLRAALRKGFDKWLQEVSPDILCLQEIRVLPEQIETDFWTPLGYHAHWFPAEKKGYSGVAILSKVKPQEISYGTQDSIYDKEGRILCLHFNQFSIMSLYIPSGTSGQARQDFKMKFLEKFQERFKEFRKKQPHWIINGDFNICHKEIDIHDPIGNKNNSGFLPEERDWLSHFLEQDLRDSFRYLHPQEPHHYSWWSLRRKTNRERNLGWRIDYQILTSNLLSHVKQVKLLPNVLHSDHCPQILHIDI
ncbi:MAG: exodeoxyribonuclease III [Cytophagales bacterium]|nr:exodeoxyribonuclease III [Cytophagales bacterium]